MNTSFEEHMTPQHQATLRNMQMLRVSACPSAIKALSECPISWPSYKQCNRHVASLTSHMRVYVLTAGNRSCAMPLALHLQIMLQLNMHRRLAHNNRNETQTIHPQKVQNCWDTWHALKGHKLFCGVSVNVFVKVLTQTSRHNTTRTTLLWTEEKCKMSGSSPRSVTDTEKMFPKHNIGVRFGFGSRACRSQD
jgi:hypothetical protein